jgi:hypothetical protein
MATRLLPDPASATAETDLERTLEALEQVRRDLLERARRFDAVVAELPGAARFSARNLIHYLGLSGRTTTSPRLRPSCHLRDESVGRRYASGASAFPIA